MIRVRRDLFRLRGDERAPASPALHLAVEYILLPHAQQSGGIGVVEVCDVQRAGLVEDRALDQGQPLADAADPGFGADDRADGILVLRVDVCDAGDAGSVLIVARIGFKRVAQRADMQFFKQLCLFRADALDKLDAVVECRHRSLLCAYREKSDRDAPPSGGAQGKRDHSSASRSRCSSRLSFCSLA